MTELFIKPRGIAELGALLVGAVLLLILCLSYLGFEYYESRLPDLYVGSPDDASFLHLKKRRDMNFQGRVYSFQPQVQLADLGYSALLGVMSEDAYSIYRAEWQGKKGCNRGFVTRYVEWYQLVVQSSYDAERINRLSLGLGDEVGLMGSVGSFYEAKWRGRDFTTHGEPDFLLLDALQSSKGTYRKR